MILFFVLLGLVVHFGFGWISVRILKNYIRNPKEWSKSDDMIGLVFVLFGIFSFILTLIGLFVNWIDDHGNEKSKWKIF